jgi:hypothetical protein
MVIVVCGLGRGEDTSKVFVMVSGLAVVRASDEPTVREKSVLLSVTVCGLPVTMASDGPLVREKSVSFSVTVCGLPVTVAPTASPEESWEAMSLGTVTV